MKKKFRLMICCPIVLSLVICLVVALISCGDNFPYPYEEMKEKVIGVEVVSIAYTDYSNTKSDVIKVLDEEEIDEFLILLSKIKLTYPMGDPSNPYNYPQDYVFIIYYDDDSYEMLGRNATKFFDGQGEKSGGYHRRFTKNSFNDLLSKFIVIKQ